MRLLIDTHILVWAADDPDRLSKKARHLLSDPQNQLWFSSVSIWEVALKSATKNNLFRIDPPQLHRDLLATGYNELAFTGLHAVSIGTLPNIHKDPFDRALLAQAITERMSFVTKDSQIQRYPAADIIRV